MSRLVAIRYKIKDYELTKNYYNKHFSMKNFGSLDNLHLIGYGGTHIVLDTNQDTQYRLGAGFGHVAIATTDLYGVCAKIKEDGGNLTRDPGPVKGGTTEIAFVEAPEGFKFELIQRDSTWVSPMLHLMLRVGDLNETQSFYEALGLKFLRTSVNEPYKYSLIFMGYDKEEESTVFEFTYNWGVSEYDLGDVYVNTVLGIENFEEVVQRLQKLGKDVSINSDNFGKFFEVSDPIGYKLLCYEKVASESWIAAFKS